MMNTYKGETVPPLNFDIFFEALNNIYENVKRKLLLIQIKIF